jgi:hypothetical protein
MFTTACQHIGVFKLVFAEKALDKLCARCACAAARRGGSKHMRLLAQHSVGENPYSRAPLHAAMAGLAQRPDAGGRLLFDQPLAKLHPASWCGPLRSPVPGASTWQSCAPGFLHTAGPRHLQPPAA